MALRAPSPLPPWCSATSFSVWLGLCSVLVARGSRVLSRPRVRVWLDRVTALVLLGFAAWLAFDTA
jgi:threonine/homoserine/homoserine lactone efflux protein